MLLLVVEIALLVPIITLKVFLFNVGLSSYSMLTSLTSKGTGSFGWFGENSTEVLKWAPDQPNATGGACAGIRGIGLQSENCNALHHFICEEKPKTTTNPTTTTPSTTALSTTIM